MRFGLIQSDIVLDAVEYEMECFLAIEDSLSKFMISICLILVVANILQKTYPMIYKKSGHTFKAVSRICQDGA